MHYRKSGTRRVADLFLQLLQAELAILILVKLDTRPTPLNYDKRDLLG